MKSYTKKLYEVVSLLIFRVVFQVNNESKEEGKESKKAMKKKAVARLTYAEMVLEAVVALEGKEGCSLQAIRKYLLSHFGLNKQHTASFNNLSMKAISRAIAMGDIEQVPRMRHSYRLSQSYRKKREEKFGIIIRSVSLYLI